MDNLDPNIFTFKEGAKNWWSIEKPNEVTKENNNAVKEICERFMKRAKKTICIGEGGFGQAWIVQWDGKPKEFVKKIYKRITATHEIICEVNALTIFDSEYIPKLIYSGFDVDKKWCLIMEYFKGGTICYHLDQCTIITPEGKKFIAFELALALEYIHGKNYTHGDVKPDNIALTENGHVRLIDFGHSRNVKKKIILPLTMIFFTAPEVFRGDEAGVASDRWAYGIVLCVLIQTNSPFGFVGQNNQEIYNEALNSPPYLDNINDDDAKDLITKLVNPDPSQRYAEITKHVYFKNVMKNPPFKPGIVELKHIDDLENGDGCLTEDEVYATLMKEALKIPTIAYLESIENHTIVNKEIKNLQTCDKLKKCSNDKKENVQVDDVKLTKSKDGEKVPAGKATKPKDAEKATKPKAAKKEKSDKKSKKFSIFKKIKNLFKKK